ncbi:MULTISPECIES: hypothetical protein [unclassified Microcoleus]|uniref:hypothetical protein n=1 Tax=unclassified Microcoleus TaxID=2642155 RepID=UPI001DE076F8|nr:MULTISPECIES: hypothetical protein [unclassified Microcoleus]MCC3440242.1 hypothetical protein [Microcoleus sp. PH2017_03_ELD_O_A]MCC3501510.1 hypothetical protein [Microcoleus sp. PH2017_19_SFW_U_A]TAF91713.1 MAG: hypothetical protein EAZ49_04115 [Oscillatoriales cyanobacterium]MCC3446368.1 hypothetical protein [Microcoleus sp. PH2017_09_SFU_O_A]MCC3520596.1 hypothetical protein [Microcoleus sp. PH2017_20_SFW_D_A]
MKKITVVKGGGTASTEVVVYPGDSADNLIALVTEPLGLPKEGRYLLQGVNETAITGDVYKAVNEGDKLTLYQPGTGG